MSTYFGYNRGNADNTYRVYNRGISYREHEGADVTDLTLMTFASDPATVLPSLALLSHRVRVLPMDAASLVKMPENTILFLDARDDLATAKTLCRLIHASGLSTPIVLILTEGGFTVVNSQWGIADVVVASASPAEVEGRLRLVSERGNAPASTAASTGEQGVQNEDGLIRSGDLVVDTNGYTASLHGHPIDLAYKEFELLKYLVQHPGRVFTRSCCRRCGATTITAAPALWTCISVVCAPSWVASTSISSAPCATSAIVSIRRKRMSMRPRPRMRLTANPAKADFFLRSFR